MTNDIYPKIPAELKELKQWVGVNRQSKLPKIAFSPEEPASSSNPETWSDYETACNGVRNGTFDNAGFVFDGNGIVGIDIDDGIGADGFLTPLAIDIMKHCQSFTEYSRSGRGMHIYLKGDLPFDGRNNRKGVEIYKDGRYFIVTGKTLIFDKIIENQKAIDYIIETYFSDIRISTKTNKLENIYKPIYSIHNNKITIYPEYPPINQGSRNISLTSLAGQLHSQGCSKEMLTKELIKVNSTKCNPPLDFRELKTIIRSVTRYER